MHKAWLDEQIKPFGSKEAFWADKDCWGNNVNNKEQTKKWMDHQKASCDYHNNVIAKKFPTPTYWTKYGFKVIEVEVDG